jgi:branched-chain amino acid transport system substrate-binding protein
MAIRKLNVYVVMFLVGLLFAGIVGGCSRQPGTIKIGAFYPLTGTNAAKGQLNRNGTELAVEDINNAGGILGMKVEVLYEDTQSKKEVVPNVVRKLIEQDKVIALLGEVASSNSIAAAPVLKQFKRPAIAPTSTNPKVTMDPEDLSKVNPYYFRACFIDPLQGTVMANFAYNKLGKRKAALIYNIAQDYNKGLAQYFKQRFTELGGIIVAEETYPDQTQDFKPQLTKIKAQNPEIIISPNTYAETGLILRQANELGMTQVFMAGDASHAPKVIEIAGQEAAQNLYLTTLYVSDDPDPKAQAFAKKYRDKYNEEPNSNSCFSYEAMMVLAEAIKKAGKLDPEAIRDALESIRDVDVPSGKFTMDPGTHNPLNKPVVVIKVKDNGFTFVDKVTPQ